MSTEVELRFRQADWDRLVAHLLRGDHDEHGAAVLCGLSRSDGRMRLLVREVVLAADGVDYVPGVRGYRHLDGEFVTKQLRRAKDLSMAYLAAHNHGGDHEVSFSRDDLDSHERAYPTLLAVNGEAVGGLVLARGALAGDVWLPTGDREPIHLTTIVGDKLTQLIAGPAVSNGQPSDAVDPTRTRQALIFGADGQRLLERQTVGVVGAGGVGMLVIQALARLGVGRFVIIDPDVVSMSNLSRLPEVRKKDAIGRFEGPVGRLLAALGIGGQKTKVAVARRIVLGANPRAQVIALQRDVADNDVARQLRDCDFMFLAADTMLARDIVNQIAYQYLIPTLQIGSKVQVERNTGRVVDTFGVVRSLGTSPGCLRCNGLIDVGRLTEEALGDVQQRKNQRYVDEPGLEAPSVITINAMSVGWAVNDFMHYTTGLSRPSFGYRILRTRPVSGGPQLTVQHPDVDVNCHVCGIGAHSALSRGDSIDLPTRMA